MCSNLNTSLYIIETKFMKFKCLRMKSDDSSEGRVVTIGGINFGGDFNLIHVTVRLDGDFRPPVRRLSWYTF